MMTHALKYKNKQQVFNEWFPGKRTIRVPKVTQTFPGHLRERLVYGALLDAIAKAQLPSHAELGRLTGVDRRQGIKEALHLLRPLLDADGFPVRPVGDAAGMLKWFGHPGEKDWYRHIQYYRIFSPSDDTPLTYTANALLFRLHDLLLGDEDGLSLTGRSTKKGLAVLLGCNRNTVRNGIAILQDKDRLKGQKLIQLYHEPGSDDFGFGLMRPTLKHLSFWRDRAETKAVVEMPGMDDHEAIEDVAEHKLSNRESVRIECARALLGYGVPPKLLPKLLIYADELGRECFAKIAWAAVEDHRKNKAKNPSLPDHPGELILSNLKQVVGH